MQIRLTAKNTIQINEFIHKILFKNLKKRNPENTFINYKKGELNSTTSLKNAINKQLMAVCF